jgi:transcriptional regulator with XRE-family HTH domain
MKHSLPQRLRLLRQEMKMTQEEMARVILVPRATYTHYELGKRTPDLDTIIQLAQFHHVSVDFLLGATWLRPTLEAWISANLEQEPAAPGLVYPENIEPAGEKIADRQDEE